MKMAAVAATFKEPTLPAPGISLEDKRAVTRALLTSGATIAEMNCLRKHLSAIKGGRLAAAAAPARVVSLAISDVPGDDPAVIASGPTVPDPTTFADARAILEKYRIEPPAAVAAHLAAARESCTPRPLHPRAVRRSQRRPRLRVPWHRDLPRPSGPGSNRHAHPEWKKSCHGYRYAGLLLLPHARRWSRHSERPFDGEGELVAIRREPGMRNLYRVAPRQRL